MRSLASQNSADDEEEKIKYQDPDSFIRKNKENENEGRATLLSHLMLDSQDSGFQMQLSDENIAIDGQISRPLSGAEQVSNNQNPALHNLNIN